MLVNKGDIVLISHRRLFPEDPPRFFTGIVDEFDFGLVRITGYTWQHELVHGSMSRKTDRRTKIISLSSGLYFAYLLPGSVDIEKLSIVQKGSSYHLTDKASFSMDMTDRLALTES